MFSYCQTCTEFGVLLLIASVIAGGILGAVARAWSLHARLYSLQDRLNVLEGVQNREVKIRAAGERFKRPSKEEAAIEAALLHAPGPPAKEVPWWQNPNLKKGAYTP